jgi:hypothetical protein
LVAIISRRRHRFNNSRRRKLGQCDTRRGKKGEGFREKAIKNGFFQLRAGRRS